MIEIKDVAKRYMMGKVEVEALRGVSLKVRAGEFVSVMGPSGSGKSTLMNVIGCLDRPTTGSYQLEGVEMSGMDDNELAHVRNRRIGFVFQTFNLLPRLSALKNVELPMIYSGVHAKERRARALTLLERVGLGERAFHNPTELSGGQQQRVAIARALINSPAMLLADEPTGNLDSRAGAEIIEMFKELNAGGMTLVMVTHDKGVGMSAKRLLWLKDGLIESDEAVS